MFIKAVLVAILCVVFCTPALAGETHSFIKPNIVNKASSHVDSLRVTDAKSIDSKKVKFDTSFKIALGFNIAGIVADQGSTKLTLDRCGTCYEGNILFRRKTGQAHYTRNAIVSAVPIIVAVLLEKKGHRRAARTLLWVAGSIRFVATAHNLSIK